MNNGTTRKHKRIETKINKWVERIAGERTEHFFKVIRWVFFINKSEKKPQFLTFETHFQAALTNPIPIETG